MTVCFSLFLCIYDQQSEGGVMLLCFLFHFILQFRVDLCHVPLYTVYLRTYIDSCGLYKGRPLLAYDTLHLRLLWHPKVRISLCVVSNFCLYNWNSLGERRIKHLLWWKWFNCWIVASCTTTPYHGFITSYYMRACIPS